MTAETAPVRARLTIGGPAGPGSEREARRPSLPDRLAWYGIWVAVVARILGDRRFQAGVITRVTGAYALASVIKNNQARPMRRAAAWYDMRGRVRGIKVRSTARGRR
jgi:hypothetical protein